MKIHPNAKLTQAGRLALCQSVAEGEPVTDACWRVGLSRARFYVWWHRYQENPELPLADRSSAPRWSQTRITDELVGTILALRIGLQKEVAEIAEALSLN